jgi:hypothetical protein
VDEGVGAVNSLDIQLMGQSDLTQPITLS